MDTPNRRRFRCTGVWGLLTQFQVIRATHFPHSMLDSRLPHYEHIHIQDGCDTPKT